MESIPGRFGSPGGGHAGTPIVRPVHPLRPWLIGLIYWIALIPLTSPPRHSGNVWSRYMTIESLVERGTFAIGRSPLLKPSGSPDLARYGGRLYSDKPPVLSMAGALVYAPLYHWGGMRFAGPRGDFRHFPAVNLVLVSALVGLASAWSLVWVRRLLQVTSFRAWVADLLTLGVGFGTPLLTYGVTFNNHSVAAGLIAAAFGLVTLEDPARHRVARRRAWAGLFAGLAATIDLPAGGATFLVLGGWLAARQRRFPLAYLGGAIGPALLHGAAQWSISGSVLPVELDRAAMEYPGSYWASAAGRFHEAGPRWRFGLELLLGPQGWLTITPSFALAPIGLALAARRGPLRGAARAASALILALLGFYIWGVHRTDYGGLSFGVRHLLAIAPLVGWFALVGLDRVRRRRLGLAFALASAVGAGYAYEGMRDPWSRADRRPEPALRILQRLVLCPRSSYQR